MKTRCQVRSILVIVLIFSFLIGNGSLFGKKLTYKKVFLSEDSIIHSYDSLYIYNTQFPDEFLCPDMLLKYTHLTVKKNVKTNWFLQQV